MTQHPNPSNEKQQLTPVNALLPHESAFIAIALARAAAATASARQDYKVAAANTGGDWVNDDPTSQAALHETGMRQATEKTLRALSHLPIIPYPEVADETVLPGSRLIVDVDGEADTYDVATRKIPGLDVDPTILAIMSSESPMGTSLIGHTVGDTAHWKLDNGRSLEGTIISIDQLSQQLFYQKLGLLSFEFTDLA